MATTARAIRIPDDIWRAALDRARSDGTTVTGVVLLALQAYIDGE